MSKNTDAVEKLLRERYYLKDDQGNVIEDWEGLCRRVAGAISGDDIEFRETLSELFIHKDCIMASPTLMNADARLKMLSSCFVYNIEDDTENIFNVLKDCGMTFKKGGGVGLDLSKIRPAGSLVKTTSGYANGPVGLVMPLLNVTGEAIKGGGLRKAAILTVLNISHPDILTFIDSKKKEGQFENMNVSVSIPAEFWEHLEVKKPWPLNFNDKEYGFVDPDELLNKIAQINWENGEPGIIFLDTVNKYNFISNLGAITHANPCVTGDTEIKTIEGDIPIRALVGRNISVLSFNENNKIFEFKQGFNVVKTKETSVLIKITLQNGMFIKVTDDHKVLIESILNNFEWKEAGNLTLNDAIVIHDSEEKDGKVWRSLIKNLERLNVKEDVYDMTVEDNHNFIANGLVAHNCGEFYNIPYNSCNLASINLNNCLIKQVKYCDVHWEKLAFITKTLTKALDNTIDVNQFPIPQVAEMTKKTRPLGLGVFGLANVLIQLGLKYSSEEGRQKAKEIVEFITYTSMVESVNIALQKGSFSAFKGSAWDFKCGKNLKQINPWLFERITDSKSNLNWTKLVDEITKNGIRNCHTTIMMPTGSVSFICDSGESAGIEPIYKNNFKRLIVSNEINGQDRHEDVYSSVAKEWLDSHASKELPEYFEDAHSISPEDHVKMQSVLQSVVHSGISKSINLKNDYTQEGIKSLIILAHKMGCKGLTFYRDGSKTKQVFTEEKQKPVKSVKKSDGKLALENVEQALRYRIKDLEVDPEGQSKQYIYVTMKDGNPVEIVTKFDAETKEQFIAAMRDRSLISRLISVALRYGVPLEEVISHCEKTSSNMYDFPYQLAAILKGHLEKIYKDKEMSVKAKKLLRPICPKCKSEMIYSEGCVSCLICGHTKCG